MSHLAALKGIDSPLSASDPYESNKWPDAIPSPPVFGAPGVRDPQFPCSEFMPGEPDRWGKCDGDGHYLCRGCKHFVGEFER